MYFAVGWPKLLQVAYKDSSVVHISSSYDRLLFVVLTQSTVSIWFCKVSFVMFMLNKVEGCNHAECAMMWCPAVIVC